MSTYTCPNGHPSASSDYCDVCGAPIGMSSSPDTSSSSGASSASPAASPSTPVSATGTPCPNCALVNASDALFCEGCGYDFTTGTMPRQTASANPLDLGATPETSSASAQAAAGPTTTGQAAAGGAATGQAAAGQAQTPDPASPSTTPASEVTWVAEVWVDPDWYADQTSDQQCPSPGLPVVVPLLTRSLLIGRSSKSRNIHPEIECASDIGVSRRQAQLTTDGQRWWVEDLQSANGTFVGAASAPLPTDALTPGQRRELAQDDRIYIGAWTCVVVRRATPEEQTGQA